MKRCLISGLFSLALLVNAWEAPVKIDGGTDDFFCEFPTIVRFDYSGTAYIFYHVAPNFAKLARYDGEKVEILGNASNSGRKTWTPCMVISRDGKIHMVWAEAVTRASSEYYIMYRTFQDKTWSDVVQIAKLSMPGVPGSKHAPPKVDNLRIGVDSNDNLFIAFYDQTRSRCKFISKYGDVVTQEGWPSQIGVRMKFPDIAVTDDYIHVVWQHGLAGSDSYTNMWAKRENKVGGKWLPMVDLKQGRNYPRSSHTPLVTLDDKENPHFIYMDDGDGPGREILYKYWTGTALSDREFLSPNRGWWSNNCIAMFNEDNGFLSGHMVTRAIYCDWKVNGDWTGVKLIENTQGADNEWSDLSKDGKVAIVSYTNNWNSVWVVTSSKLITNESPKAVISIDKDLIYWNDEVRFDSVGSKDPDGTIVKYEWRIIEDNVTKQGPIVHYRFNNSFGTVKVKLTVTDDNGGTGSATKAIQVQPLHPVIFTDASEIFWQETLVFKGHNSSDASGTIVKYQWDFADGTTAEGIQVSHKFANTYGDLPVKLTVTNNKNVSASATKIIKVKPRPFPVITSDLDEIFWQDTVVFDGSHSLVLPGYTVKYGWDFGDGEYAEGTRVSHKFANGRAYGDKLVKLTMIDDKNISASATKIIKVKAFYTAHTTFEKINIRTLSYDRMGYRVTWTANAKNATAGYNIVKYRIFRKPNTAAGAYTQIAEVDVAVNEYLDMSIDQAADYEYVACSVGALGHVSPVDNF